MWWGQSEHSGDWVVSLGGYHPRYKIPDHYPKQNRIGISFAFKDLVQVTGEVYFALTRSVAMLGLRQRYSISCGPLKAWFEWSVDFILFWDPFFIFAQAGIQIGASLTFWFFGTRTVSVSVSGQVDLWGPPFAGVVKLQVIGTSFEIRFGDENSQHPLPSAKSFPDFVESTLNTNAPLSLPINDGVVKDLITEKQAYDYEYVVNPEELRFSIQTKIPVKNAVINGSGLKENCNSNSDVGWNCNVGVVACAQAENEFKSQLEISITSGTETVDPSAFIITPIKTIESIALWNPKGMTHTGVNDKGRIENVLEGFSLSTAPPQRGNQIGPMSVSALIGNKITFTWPQISVQDAYTQAPSIGALQGQINSESTNSKRKRMLNAMQRQQSELRTTVHLDDTAKQGDKFFLAEPVFNPLGR